MPSRIRVVALAVLRRPGSEDLFVDEMTDPQTGRPVHRPAGGEIEFGETAAETIARELDEEYGLAVRVGRRLDLLENRFVLAGQPGHEIVVVHEAELLRPETVGVERIACRDQPGTFGVWRRPS